MYRRSNLVSLATDLFSYAPFISSSHKIGRFLDPMEDSCGGKSIAVFGVCPVASAKSTFRRQSHEVNGLKPSKPINIGQLETRGLHGDWGFLPFLCVLLYLMSCFWLHGHDYFVTIFIERIQLVSLADLRFAVCS